MISYAMVGSKDLKRSGEFFDKLLGIVGAQRVMDSDTSIIWSNDADKPFFFVCLPHDGNEATVGNGTMISFGAESKEQVHEIYQAATDNGGSCEGEPGMRGDAYYMAYFRDPDGNKFSAFYSVK